MSSIANALVRIFNAPGSPLIRLSMPPCRLRVCERALPCSRSVRTLLYQCRRYISFEPGSRSVLVPCGLRAGRLRDSEEGSILQCVRSTEVQNTQKGDHLFLLGLSVRCPVFFFLFFFFCSSGDPPKIGHRPFNMETLTVRG